MIRNIPEKLYREFFSSHPDDYVFPETPNRNLVEFVRQIYSVLLLREKRFVSSVIIRNKSC